MKLAIVAFFLLRFHFATLDGIKNCTTLPPCNTSVKGAASLPQPMDEFPRGSFTVNCPLPLQVDGFRMKLLKGQSEVCILYMDNGVQQITDNGFCDSVHPTDRVVSFGLRNLNRSHSDTYVCCLETLDPVYDQCKAREIHLYIQEEACLFSNLTSWILVGIAVFSMAVCIVSLIVCSCRAVVCRHGCTSHDYNNEYMSMAAVKPT